MSDTISRVRCFDVLQDIKEQAIRMENDRISSRECGFIVRKCFPHVKRIHSNHVYYYEGIRRILANDFTSHDVEGKVVQLLICYVYKLFKI